MKTSTVYAVAIVVLVVLNLIFWGPFLHIPYFEDVGIQIINLITEVLPPVSP